MRHAYSCSVETRRKSNMEEKQPVVIQGRSIHRERAKERASGLYGRSSYSSRAGYQSLRDFGKGEQTGLEYPDSSFERAKGEYIYSTSLAKLRQARRTERSPAYPSGSRPRVRPRTRPSSSLYSMRQSTDSGFQINSLAAKIAISVLIVLVILLLNSIKLPFAQAVVDYVRTAITNEFDLDDALGKLKFVGQSIPKEIKSVFGQDAGDKDTVESLSVYFSAPVKGEVIQTFQEQVSPGTTSSVYQNQGIVIITAENAPIFSAADGVVTAVEHDEIYGPSIWVDHGNEVFSYYGGCGDILVKVGQSVDRGDRMGTVRVSNDSGKPVLHFQIWIDDKPVDPLDYIQHADKASKQRGV
jgi:murein DD-endopeptidase MepM/ murein hydrolase activator NlpD